RARSFEVAGFDVIQMPDRPQLPSSLPGLAAAAAVTDHIGIGSYVLAASLRSPEAAVRDCAAVVGVCGRRFEVGIGAGLEGGTRSERRDRLAGLARAIRTRFPAHRLLIAASGPDGLAVAAEHADV